MNKQFTWSILIILSLGAVVTFVYLMEHYWMTKPVSYTYLQKLLKSGQWRGADEETSKIVLLKASGRNSFQIAMSGVSFSEFANFPCNDLLIIDQLWLQYSGNRFGFSVQQSVWQPTDVQISPQNILNNQIRFREQVGWTGENLDNWNYSLGAPKGHLPSSRWLVQASPKLDGMNVYKLDRLLSRTKECYLLRRE